MNKGKFLNSLKRKLSILDEQEIIDILNEYEDIIDEKIKDGKTEEEAVNEFGSVDELASEILKTYKLNSKYAKENEPVKEVVENIEDGIKKLSHYLAKSFKNLNGGNGVSIDLVCELIIKFLILLVVLAVLQIPFRILFGIGSETLDIAFYPLDEVLSGFWHIATSLLYFVVAALIFVSFFRQYFKIDDNKKEINNLKNASKNNTNSSKKNTDNNLFESVNDNIESRTQDDNVIVNILLCMFKVFMVILFIIPLWCTNFGLTVALSIVIYYSIIGINIWGSVILITGLLIGFSWLTSFFHSITFKSKRMHAISLVISLILTVIGSLVFVSNILSFDYIDESKKMNTNYEKYSEKFNIEEKQVKFDSYNYYDEIKYEINNELENNTVSIEIEYPKELYVIKDVNIVSSNDNNNNYYYIDIDNNNIDRFNLLKKVYNTFIDNLKQGKIYRSIDSSYVVFKIYANEETMKLIIK